MARKAKAPRPSVWAITRETHHLVGRVAELRLDTGPAFGRITAVLLNPPGDIMYRVTVTGGPEREIEYFRVRVLPESSEREEGGEGGVHHADTLRTAGVAPQGSGGRK